MSLIECKCPNCGGVMKVDNGVEKAICPYCGTTTVIGMPVTVNNGNYIRSQVNNTVSNNYESGKKIEVDFTILGLFGMVLLLLIIIIIANALGFME